MDPDDSRERQRLVMTLCIADFAIEWLRPMPPNFKLVGPVLPEPARPLPADLEVHSFKSFFSMESNVMDRHTLV